VCKVSLAAVQVDRDGGQLDDGHAVEQLDPVVLAGGRGLQAVGIRRWKKSSGNELKLEGEKTKTMSRGFI
jgi:hypothetical protein